MIAGLHDGQLAVHRKLLAKVPRIVVPCPRRSGKTEGIGLALGERLLELDQFVVRILTTNLEAPSESWLTREGDGGFVGLLRELGIPHKTTAIGGSARGVKAIRFPWGSAILVHDLANMGAVNRKRGFRANVFWIDEAQNMALLAIILDTLVSAAAADFEAPILLSGTPGTELGTLFHRAATGGDPAYDVVSFSCVLNPMFGDHPGDRWRNYLERQGMAGDRTRLGIDDATWKQFADLTAAELHLLGTAPLDDLPEELCELLTKLPANWIREHLGRWVEKGAQYVYPTTGLSPEAIYWANDGGSSEFDRLPGFATLGSLTERVAALPADRLTPEIVVKRDWRCAVAFDLGYHPDPFAWWAGVYSDDPGMYEVWSGAELELMDSDMLERVSSVTADLQSEGLWLAAAIVDATGQRKGTQVDWSWRLAARFPEGSQGVIAPYKAKEVLQRKAVNIDVQRGVLKALRGSPADIEQRYLQFKPFNPVNPKEQEVHKYRQVHLLNGTAARPGDHCMDARRYVVWWVHHHGQVTKPVDAATNGPVTAAGQIQEMASVMRRRELG